MATELRPNWIDAGTLPQLDPMPPLPYAFLYQPVPAADQSATVLRAWGWATSGVDVSAESLVFSCWTVGFDGAGKGILGRQVGDSITVGVPAVAAMAAAINQPFFLQFIDVRQPQAGAYAIVFDPTSGTDMSLVQNPPTVIYPIAP